MNYINKYGKQKGIGLIEVLVSTVVVAVGLLAVSSLQGQFMSSSGQTKTSAEAIKLAEAKIEEFRNSSELKNTTTLSGFFYISSGADTKTRSNATFTRTWTVTDLTNPIRKDIVVKVTWPPASANESVNVISQIAWLNPGNSAYYANAAASAGVMAKAPDPNQNSSTPGAAPGQPSSYAAGTGTALTDGSNLRTSTDAAGNLLLLNAGGSVLQTFFGGKINTFKGTVYTVNDFTTLNMVVSENGGYCVYTSSEITITGGKKRDYICYTGGNCKNSAGSNGCPASPTAQQQAAQNSVGPGGWYGNIGFAGLGISGRTQEKVCFPNVTGFAAREYLTHRTTNGVVTSAEGINQSFACHDFLIVDQTGANSDCGTVSTSFVMAAEPQKITRLLTGNSTDAPNTVLAEDTTYCPATTYSITVASNSSGWSISSSDCGSGASCRGLSAGTYNVTATITSISSNSTYTCSKSYAIASANIAVAVTAGSGSCSMTP
ncbi:MAG: hypothetical protein PHY16_03790 [Methylobacter sp.]|nr:hypothetical protein [Methylobacter sp.]